MVRKIAMLHYAGVIAFFLGALVTVPALNAQTQLQVYGLWHCSSDACSWAAAPNMTTFDAQNHWIIDRGNGSPSVNLVVLSFVNPVKLMNLTTDSTDTNGIPNGMTMAVVNYFESKGVRVMMSVGGVSYTKDWDKALGSNPTQLGINAANAAKQFNIGIEIDYEKSSNPNLAGLQKFVTAFRSVNPYDPTGANQAARLTVDLGDGDTYLTALANYASTNWLTTANPVLDYANAMVSSQKTAISASEGYWQQHISGLSGSVPPLAPAKLAGSVWVVGNNVIPNCNSYSSSDQEVAANFVETVGPAGAGTTSGMLGYMFWGGGCQGNGTVCTFPPDTCEGGVGVGATALNIPVPMPALRQN
ncbi:MAG: glycoside hydrolase family 18 protein [Candidatus Sulfotelmatobacter sp.]